MREYTDIKTSFSEKIYELEDNDLKEFLDLKKFVTNNDMSIEENYEIIKNQIDMDSYCDYYGMMIYNARSSDWPYSYCSIFNH